MDTSERQLLRVRKVTLVTPNLAIVLGGHFEKLVSPVGCDEAALVALPVIRELIRANPAKLLASSA